jgi:hypothetical protein
VFQTREWLLVGSLLLNEFGLDLLVITAGTSNWP